MFRFGNGENPSHFINFNGPEVGSGQSGAALSHNGRLLIGSGFTNRHYYTGDIFEILIFNKALSDEELAKVSYYLAAKWDLDIDSDGDGIMDDEDNDLYGVSFNSPPDITSSPSSPPRYGIEHSEYSFYIKITDQDGDEISSISIVQPDNATVLPSGNNESAILLWTPNSSQIGRQEFIIEAQDSNGNISQFNHTVTVSDMGNDEPFGVTFEDPIVYAPFAAGDKLTDLLAIDPDSTDFTYRLVSGEGSSGNESVLLYGSTLFAVNDLDESTEIPLRVEISDGEFTVERTTVLQVVFKDTDNDGVADVYDIEPNDASIAGYSADFSDTMDLVLESEAEMDEMETHLSLWMDGSNIDANQNQSLAIGDIVPIWVDLSGNGHHGTKVGSPEYEFEDTIYFPSGSDYFSIEKFTSSYTEGEVFLLSHLAQEPLAVEGFIHGEIVQFTLPK